jgi:2-polyprenyl-3-methyl-5-hydroxy-6-metoxy-1,4-benzoquinol methylase
VPSDLEQLKTLLAGKDWPEAVNPVLICDPNSEKDKEDRAVGVIELMVEDDLVGKKFLDMGCGEGHCVVAAAKAQAAAAVGYDIVESPRWAEFSQTPGVTFTSDFAKVLEQGPYNVILVFDVIDHLINDSQAEFLKLAKSALAPGGKIYMRAHPRTSRHATHLYHDLNKAFVHLVFTEDELKEIVPNPTSYIKNMGPTRPLGSYDYWLEEAGLVKVSRREVREPVEEFFKQPLLASRIMKNADFQEFPQFQTEMVFVDFVLAAK